MTRLASPLPLMAGLVMAMGMGCATPSTADEPIREWKYQQKIAVHTAARGDFNSALKLIDQALKEARRRLGPLHPSLLDPLSDRITLYRMLGKYNQAQQDAQWGLALAKQFGTLAQQARAGLNLAALHIDMGRFAEASVLLFEPGIPLPPKSHWKVELYASQARLLREQGRFEDATGPLDKAMKAFENKEENARAWENLQLETADDYFAYGNTAQAMELYQAVLDQRSARMSPKHVDRAAALEGLARCHKKLGKVREADNFYKQALALRVRTLGPNRWQSIPYLHPAGLLYLEMGDYKKSAAMLLRVARIHAKSQGKGHPAVATVSLSVAKAYDGIKKEKAARREREAALKIFEAALGKNHPRTRAAQKLLNN